MPLKRLDWVITGTAVVLAAALFLRYAGDGLRAYFTADDVMNLYVAVFRRAAEWQRPASTAFYRVLFDAFGLQPLPYRIACYALLIANLALLWAVCRRLSGSLEVAAVAIVLAAYHAHLADLYYSTGTIVDILCFFFYFAAFWLYIRTRRLCNQRRSAAWLIAVLALYAGALAAKEIAATLPILLLLYDLVYHPPANRAAAPTWTAREALRLAPLALPTAAFAYLKTSGATRVTTNPAFLPTFSWQVFTANWRHYAHDLFYGASDFQGWRIVALWAAVVALAAVLRRRDAWIAAAICLIGILPVVFIPERGFYAVYVTLPGWYLLAARTLTTLRERLLPRAGAWDSVGLLLVLALGLAAVHAREKPLGMTWVAAEHDSVRRTLEPLKRYSLPAKAEVLVTADPYDPNDSVLLGIFRLRFRDPGITVRRLAARPGEHYDAVFTYASPSPGALSTLVRQP